MSCENKRSFEDEDPQSPTAPRTGELPDLSQVDRREMHSASSMRAAVIPGHLGHPVRMQKMGPKFDHPQPFYQAVTQDTLLVGTEGCYGGGVLHNMN